MRAAWIDAPNTDDAAPATAPTTARTRSLAAIVIRGTSNCRESPAGITASVLSVAPFAALRCSIRTHFPAASVSAIPTAPEISYSPAASAPVSASTVFAAGAVAVAPTCAVVSRVATATTVRPSGSMMPRRPARSSLPLTSVIAAQNARGGGRRLDRARAWWDADAMRIVGEVLASVAIGLGYLIVGYIALVGAIAVLQTLIGLI